VKPPVASDFMKYTGPWIVVATVLVPLIVAATMNWMKAAGQNVQAQADTTATPARTLMNHLYGALVAPLAELAGRLRWGVLIIFGMILTYSLVFNIWSSFAFPFYLDFLHYTKDQVAFASKLFGIIMTMVGVSMAGYLFARIGRLPTMLVGAILPILGNFIYADLAEGGAHIDVIGNTLGFNALAGWFGYDAKMTRLLMAITFENISTGIAGAAFVAYVSGIVSKKYTAVQYALLSSLTFLIGSMARALAGQWFDTYGYAPVFRWTAAAGLFAVVFVCFEWVRVSRANREAVRLR
jgi:PAT family beta-lactamase induction signal transducer AmpG